MFTAQACRSYLRDIVLLNEPYFFYLAYLFMAIIWTFSILVPPGSEKYVAISLSPRHDRFAPDDLHVKPFRTCDRDSSLSILTRPGLSCTQTA